MMTNSKSLTIILIFFLLLLVSCKTAVELKTAWNPNTETDLSHYNLYRVYQGNYQKINDAPIPHPTTTCTFKLKLSDDFSGPLCFVVTAVDTSGNESNYSEPVCFEK
jgi:hypothetical protein